MSEEQTPPETPAEALARLQAGNARFAAGNPRRPNQSANQRAQLAAAQQPWAVVWGCIDSRVPAEIVFDQGLGDLFVIRTAGHAVDAISLGSAEFAVAGFEVPLLVVLGHERCGAVSATLEAIEQSTVAPGNVQSVIDAIRPAAELTRGLDGSWLEHAIRANARAVVARLRTSPVLQPAITAGKLDVVGAIYDLDTGNVTFEV